MCLPCAVYIRGSLTNEGSVACSHETVVGITQLGPFMSSIYATTYPLCWTHIQSAGSNGMLLSGAGMLVESLSSTPSL